MLQLQLLHKNHNCTALRAGSSQVLVANNCPAQQPTCPLEQHEPFLT